MGSGGVGGRRYQIAAVLLTYIAVSLAAVPIAVSQHTKQRSAQAQAQATANSPNVSDSHSNSPKMSPAKAVSMLALVGLASPFLALSNPMQGIIGLIILFVGIRIAWRITAASRVDTRSSNTILVHVLRYSAENPFNHRVECCGTPTRHADAPGRNLFRLLPGYVGDGVAPNDMAINIEHDVSRNPHLVIVEGAQNGCTHHAQHRPHVLRILNGLKKRAHRRIVIEPCDRAKDFVFGHEATYTPGYVVDQISYAALPLTFIAIRAIASARRPHVL
jgi:hypothetical protein